ncbi:metallophosphoesterase [Roseofilum sp. BLCC_M154]|uniref:Metallophosphoesterase n=1 Tax=Roseofilum acuticapitatum BLCC-M154 TaxID=3022444 RepID=A0ABT7ANW5_9CYAN|nr:metallophosphoesterase [Roseofilum acuticapitatum]MDJ1168292.1 metallophosphoesterase [Roseofilum acuticapitatum BLCC-M154]
MDFDFQFAIISDLHIALPHTIWDHPKRFHLVELSIPALELALDRISQLDLDFLLLPGDLTQHGEPENHQWLQQRLSQLPYPVYVIPGNHDIPTQWGNETSISRAKFPTYYHQFGYRHSHQTDYTCELLPGVRLIALDSNEFDPEGKQLGYGYLNEAQFQWLEEVLATTSEPLRLVMIHHNVIEHLPDQSTHCLGKRYMLQNGPRLIKVLQEAGIHLLFTGHLHVQDIAQQGDLYEITTGSLVSYPHAYRTLRITSKLSEKTTVKIASHQIKTLPGWENLGEFSREWMGERSHPFMMRLLTEDPCYLTEEEAQKWVGSLRYFWADIAQGDTQFNFSHFPEPLRTYFESFSADPELGDNHRVIEF